MAMMDGMRGMMMWGSALVWLLVVVVLVIAAVTLIKYLRSDRTK
jgi:ABC-type phosphate transport system permease subunit